MNKISVQGTLKTEEILGSSANVEKKILADLDKIQSEDHKRPFSKLTEQVVVQPYRDGEYQYHAILSEAAKMYDLSPEIQKDAHVTEE